ncbi:glycosyl hydrolase [Deinococcus misasensis]|uniref:glycosyl hydrolase n=1 Tax=Deinococcus misasensis TaxID=392413 RepID=UPI00054D98F2|nr:glycosyl hydrolase [Deinococcus misasensis]
MTTLSRFVLRTSGMLALLSLAACTAASSGPTSPTIHTVDLVDAQAEPAARSLFVYLQELRGKEILFGHQHATTEGFSITAKDGTQSEVQKAVGDFPGMFGWDTLSLEGHEKPGVFGNKTQSRDNLIQVMKKAHEQGGVLALSSHMPNFVTGGNFYDTKGNVVSQILPGGSKHAEYNHFLDMVADFALNLKDDAGQAIPVIFRPFHEQNGGWFWWGAPYRTREQYIEIYRYTVEYLRDVKGVRNFLYGFSPNGPFNNSEKTFMETYPGDEYVDILGFDSYYDGKSEGYFEGAKQDASLISRIADARGKVAAFTEFGYVGVKPTGTKDLKFFTKLLSALKSDPDAKRMAYMLTWANFGTDNIFVPYRSAPGLGSHELLSDFVQYSLDPFTSFSKQVQNANPFSKTVNTIAEKPLVHVVSPTGQQTLSSQSTHTLRTKILHAQPSKVVYSIGSDPTEFPMVQDTSSPMSYYTAQWKPDAALDESATSITVKAYLQDGSLLKDTINLYVGESSGETNPLVVDTFDRYKGSSELLDAVYSTAGDLNTITLDSSTLGSGKYGLKFAYTLGSQGYTGQVKNMSGVNWTGTNKLKLWLKPDGSGNRLVLQVNASGISFEAYPSIAGTEATWLEIPFSSFKPAPWDTGNAGKTMTPETLKDIRSFGIYVNKNDGTPNSGTLYLDEIIAVP